MLLQAAKAAPWPACVAWYRCAPVRVSYAGHGPLRGPCLSLGPVCVTQYRLLVLLARSVMSVFSVYAMGRPMPARGPIRS